MSAAVDTKKVTDRRQLRFQTLDDVLADAEMLALAGHIRALGNWTPGQIFKHLAIVFNCQIDGMPLNPPWLFRVLGRYYFKNRIINKGMRAGFWSDAVQDAKPEIRARVMKALTETVGKITA